MQIKNILKGKAVIVGIGNVMKGDDGFGPALIEKLKGTVRATCIDAGTSLENYTAVIARENPDTVLLVDAVHMDLPSGKYEILESKDIVKSGFTTHDISPRMFIEYLENQTKANIFLLGVQPEHVSFGEEMSDGVKRAVKEVSQLIREAINA